MVASGAVVDADLAPIVEAMGRFEVAADRRLRQALGMFASEVAVHAKQNHEYTDRTGRLTSSITDGTVVGSFAEGLRVDVVAGGTRGVGYASHVEYGTRPHIIRPKRRRMLRFAMGGRDVFAREVRHPGTRPYRFMRNALDAKLPRATVLVEQALDLAADEAGL